MYTTMSTILKHAARHNYAVIATSPINMEIARGMITAATNKNAPIIFLLGQNMMRQHAKAELIIPMIRTMAQYSPVPIATCLDHGNNRERLFYSIKNGFSSLMFDGSLFPFDENVIRTKEIADICHELDMSIEGELGHVGQASAGDQHDVSCYTLPEDAKRFVQKTNVDCLAIAVGTAHGKYPDGLIPHINFQRIKEIKDSTDGMPLALHGGSGAGDENILKAVTAGINKINVVTDVLATCQEYLSEALNQPKYAGSLIELMMGMEERARVFIEHWIDLSGSQGKASGFNFENKMVRLSAAARIGTQE